MTDGYANRVQTVGEVTRSIKGLLETSFPVVTVAGEVSGLRRPFSGHLYFTLKDSEAQIKAVLFKMQQRYLAGELRDGQEVVCRGRVSVYEPRGEYQLIVDVVDTKGVGTLQIAFEQLNERLAAEGLFDPAHKKPLPFLPRQIAVVTSPAGAALFDFLKMAANRFPAIPVAVMPVRVQGDGAADEIAEALQQLNDAGAADVIVLCRGGGSIEDLWAFNEERVARAIFASKIPVVAAVGHEVDFTIADFVADYRAPTPTAAAEAVMPSRDLLLAQVAERTSRLTTAMRRLVIHHRQRVDLGRRALADPSALLVHSTLRLDQVQNAMLQALQERLRLHRFRLGRLAVRLGEQNPRQRLAFQQRLLAGLYRRMAMAVNLTQERRSTSLQRLAGLLDAVSPLAVLGRGYAVVRRESDGRVVRDSNQVRTGDLLAVQVHRGSFSCEVVEEEGNGEMR